MVYIVGCVHDIQSNEETYLLEGSLDVREQRERFRELLIETLRTGKIDFVAEEWGRESETLAGALKSEHGLGYADINTTLADLERMGIPGDYTLCHYSPDQKENWHRLREQFMFDKVMDSRGDSDNVLVICGFDHMNRMAHKFEEGGEIPKVEDYRNRAWYRSGVFFPSGCGNSD